MLALLRSLDIFGQKFSFFMNGKTITKTFPGFIFTLLATGVVLGCLAFFYLVLVDTSLPVIQIEEADLDQSPQIRLVDDIFFFISLVNYRTVVPISFIPLFNRLSVAYIFEEVREDPFPTVGQNAIETRRVDLRLVPCVSTKSYEKRKAILTPLQQSLVLASGLCLQDPPATDPLTLQRSRGGRATNRKLQIDILPCGLLLGCRSFEQKKGLMFIFGVLANGYNGLDFQQPIVNISSATHRLLLFEGVHKEVEFFVQKFTSQTDSGSIFPAAVSQDGFTLEEQERIDLRPHNGAKDLPLASVSFVASHRHTTYFRSYGKVVDFISNTGGIVQVVVSLFALVYSVYNRFIHKRDLIVYGIMDLLPEQRDAPSKNGFSPIRGKPITELAFLPQSPQKVLRKEKKKSSRRDSTASYTSFWAYVFSSSKRKRTTSLSTLQQYRKHEYWNDCEKMLTYTTEVSNLLLVVNELKILQRVFFKDFHKKLGPRIAIYLMKLEIFNKQEGNRITADDSSQILSEFVQYKSTKRSQLNAMDELRLMLSEALLRDHRSYMEREHSNFKIFSGIQDLIDNAEFFSIFNPKSQTLNAGAGDAPNVIFQPIEEDKAEEQADELQSKTALEPKLVKGIMGPKQKFTPSPSFKPKLKKSSAFQSESQRISQRVNLLKDTHQVLKEGRARTLGRPKVRISKPDE